MIPLQKEKEILSLLESGGLSARKIALRVGVARETVRAVRDNQTSRAASRAVAAHQKMILKPIKKLREPKRCPICRAKVNILPCVYCSTLSSGGTLEARGHELKLDQKLGEVGRRFVYIVRDIINLDDMRVIHHPLFASLVKQSYDAMALLPGGNLNE
jgi:hypothetical protein